MQLTDNLGLSPEFLADEDVARDEDNYGRNRKCTCGFADYVREIGMPPWEGDGCRGCNPPDHENKPYGFGIEAFEDPALDRANAAMWAEIDRRGGCKYTSAVCGISTWGMNAGRWSGPRATTGDMEFRNYCWRVWSTQSARRRRHSQLMWDRLCDECETHAEAKRRYESWAQRAITKRYRDEMRDQRITCGRKTVNDDYNRAAFFEIVEYVHLHLPLACQGSEQAIAEWLTGSCNGGTALTTG